MLKMQTKLRGRWRAGLISSIATLTCATLLALWLTPAAPMGVESGELSYSVWVAIVLAAGTALFGSLTVLARNRLSGERDVVELLRAIIGLSQRRRIATPSQFRHALEKQCWRMSEDRRAALSVIVVRVGLMGPGGNLHDALDHAAEAVTPFVRLGDTVGQVNGDEVGIVAVGADATACRRIATRLERALDGAREAWGQRTPRAGMLTAEIGSTSFDLGDDPGSLLDAARARLRPIKARTRDRDRAAVDLSAAG
ncbi:MAG: diguanylate cyclase [Dehalococcoidia bacterium]